MEYNKETKYCITAYNKDGEGNYEICENITVALNRAFSIIQSGGEIRNISKMLGFSNYIINPEFDAVLKLDAVRYTD